jgi:hypothetical protein
MTFGWSVRVTLASEPKGASYPLRLIACQYIRGQAESETAPLVTDRRDESSGGPAHGFNSGTRRVFDLLRFTGGQIETVAGAKHVQLEVNQ